MRFAEEERTLSRPLVLPAPPPCTPLVWVPVVWLMPPARVLSPPPPPPPPCPRAWWAAAVTSLLQAAPARDPPHRMCPTRRHGDRDCTPPSKTASWAVRASTGEKCRVSSKGDTSLMCWLGFFDNDDLNNDVLPSWLSIFLCFAVTSEDVTLTPESSPE